ncbi:MAG: hypothetical protein R8G01_05420 [Ilumatobacteraceae bacterium]|nr:hypothetical protein [Ilumatobacteraceae bacterium]
MTFALVVVTGAVILGGLMWLLSWLGAPSWVVIAPWAVPTAATILWAIFTPVPAAVTDDDDDAWTTYSIQYVLVGEDHPRSGPARVITSTLFGAPILWSLLVFGLSTLVGLF